MTEIKIDQTYNQLHTLKQNIWYYLPSNWYYLFCNWYFLSSDSNKECGNVQTVIISTREQSGAICYFSAEFASQKGLLQRTLQLVPSHAQPLVASNIKYFAIKNSRINPQVLN